MPPTPDIAEVARDLASFQTQVGSIAARLSNPDERNVINDLLGRLRQVSGEIEPEYHKAMSIIRGRVEQAKAESQTAHADMQKSAEASRQKQQQREQQAAKPKAAAKTEAKIDPKFGEGLCKELLQRFSPSNPTGSSPLASGVKEAWEDWN